MKKVLHGLVIIDLRKIIRESNAFLKTV